MTGGVSESGRLDRVVLRRSGQEYRLDLVDPTSNVRTLTVRSGDEIAVDRRSSVFREYVLPTLTFIGSAASIYVAIDR
jgi:hypothetical protein